jgi:hypothetical protein
MEQMERREMMAGDIAGYVSGNTLHLYESYGQAGLDNSVVISQVAPGKVRVTGGVLPDGTVTKINGATEKIFTVSGGLNVTFGGGNDSVTFHKLAPPKFNNVSLDLAAPTTTNTSLTFASLSPITPQDKDRVWMSGATIPGWLTINTGADDDQVYVFNTNVGKTDLKSGAPNTGGITVNTGLGNDLIYFDGLRSNHDINIDAGAGHDKVDVLNGAVIDNFMAELGDGDDVMTIRNVNATKQSNSDTTRISGGGGTDQLTMSGSPFKNMQRTGWEYINGVRIITPVFDAVTSGLTLSVK